MLLNYREYENSGADDMTAELTKFMQEGFKMWYEAPTQMFFLSKLFDFVETVIGN